MCVPTDAHAFILYLANYMRLTAELAAPSDYLRSCLVSHGAWQEFLPRLRCVSNRIESNRIESCIDEHERRLASDK